MRCDQTKSHCTVKSSGLHRHKNQFQYESKPFTFEQKCIEIRAVKYNLPGDIMLSYLLSSFIFYSGASRVHFVMYTLRHMSV